MSDVVTKPRSKRITKAKKPRLAPDVIMTDSLTPDKLAAVTMMELFDGRRTVVAALTGYTIEDLTKWRQELLRNRRDNEPIRLRLAGRLESIITLALARIASRSQFTTHRDLNATVGIFAEKINLLVTSEIAERAPAPKPKPEVEAKPEADAPAPVVEADPEPEPADVEERQQALDLVASIMSAAEASGDEVTRDEIVEGLIKQRPDLARYLQPEGKTIDDESLLMM